MQQPSCSAKGGLAVGRCGPPNESVGVVSDVVGSLNKFSNSDGAMQKTRADLVPCNVDFNIGITDVVAALSAFGGGVTRAGIGDSKILTMPPPQFAKNPCTYVLSPETRMSVAMCRRASVPHELSTGALERPDRHESRRKRASSLESSG